MKVAGRAASQTCCTPGQMGNGPRERTSSTSQRSAGPRSRIEAPIRPRTVLLAPSQPSTAAARMELSPAVTTTRAPSGRSPVTSAPRRTSMAGCVATAVARTASRSGWCTNEPCGQPLSPADGSRRNSASVRRAPSSSRRPASGRVRARTASATPASWRTRNTSSSRCTARGSGYGSGYRSSTSTSSPRRASSSAAVSPTGPAPTTTTGSRGIAPVSPNAARRCIRRNHSQSELTDGRPRQQSVTSDTVRPRTTPHPYQRRQADEGTSVKTKGAILWGVGEEWSVEEIEVGDPAPGEVTVELAASGLCHSDEHLVTGSTPVASFPVIGGHEGSGVVTKVGPGVANLKEGDHVVTAFIPACGQCPPCAKGLQNLCDLGAHLLGGVAISDGTHRVTAKGQGVSPMCLLGTFSPYITVHQASVVKIEPSVPLEVAALVGCGVTTGWGSATKVADVRPGETVVVMGAGGVGMNAVQGAAAAGARHVVVVEPVAHKRDWATTYGATHSFATAEEATEAVNELTWGRMADKTIITVGDIQGEDIQA